MRKVELRPVKIEPGFLVEDHRHPVVLFHLVVVFHGRLPPEVVRQPGTAARHHRHAEKGLAQIHLLVRRDRLNLIERPVRNRNGHIESKTSSSTTGPRVLQAQIESFSRPGPTPGRPSHRARAAARVPAPNARRANFS